MNADYRLLFIISIVNEFQECKKVGDEGFITHLVRLEFKIHSNSLKYPPYHEVNEIKSKHFWKKFYKFTNNSFKLQ